MIYISLSYSLYHHLDDVNIEYEDWQTLNIDLYYIFSYYPLYPPSEEVNIDFEALDTYGTLPVTPHVLVLPSDLKQFTKVTISHK